MDYELYKIIFYIIGIIVILVYLAIPAIIILCICKRRILLFMHYCCNKERIDNREMEVYGEL